MDKRVRMVIEFDIDDEALGEKGLDAETVLEHVGISDNNVTDGFCIEPVGMPGTSVVSDFFLCNGTVVSKEFLPAQS